MTEWPGGHRDRWEARLSQLFQVSWIAEAEPADQNEERSRDFESTFEPPIPRIFSGIVSCLASSLH